MRDEDGRPSEVAVPSDVNLDRVWLGVTAELWRREPGVFELFAAKALRSPGLARALLTTQSLLLPWLMATAITLAAGAAVTLGTGEPLVALMAPAVSGVGIAYAYGPAVDPAWELSHVMAVSDRMVLLVRVLSVFVIDAGLGLAASAASARAIGLTFNWLVPMTAVSALALAAATLTRSAEIGVAAGLTGWTITVLAGQTVTGRFAAAVSNPSMDTPCLIFAALCVVVVLLATNVPRAASRTWEENR